MPGLLRGMARTAAVAGTATAVSGGVRRRQERRWAQQEAPQGYAEPQGGAQPQAAPAAPVAAAAPAPAAAPAGGEASIIDQLKQLAELKDQGILTEDEFAAQKAKLLG
jgi:hypothetical protein